MIFIGYWGANEGLSQSTINPHLEILARMDAVSSIHYLSMERKPEETIFKVPFHPKIQHIPYRCLSGGLRMLNKFGDLVRMYRLARKIAIEKNISQVICRSSLAGIMGYYLHRNLGLPYVVESFEPHADFMLEAGIWSRRGLSFTIQKWFEQQQKRTADYLLPVADQYRKKLIEEGVAGEKILVAPCAVDPEQFRFHPEERQAIRDQLGLGARTVGIYVGKFGGIYQEEEAFRLFKLAFENIDDFYLILLSPMDKSYLRDKLDQYQIDQKCVWFGLVPHTEVPAWLSASDFAFSLHDPTPNKKFVSPIKNGEYWSNGLPILMPDGIGDDSDIINDHPEAGILFELNESSMSEAILVIQQRLNQRTKIAETARKFRSFRVIEDGYKMILKQSQF